MLCFQEELTAFADFDPLAYGQKSNPDSLMAGLFAALVLARTGLKPILLERGQSVEQRKEDVEKFRAAVQKYLVPVAKKLYIKQAQRQGRDFPLNFADKDLAFRSGNPTPVGNPEEILAMGDKFYEELSPETHEFWQFMRSHEMLDVESKPGKAGGGYCSRIASMRSPFIFANFNGTSHDVEVVTHEAGHAFAGFANPGNDMRSTLRGAARCCGVRQRAHNIWCAGA